MDTVEVILQPYANQAFVLSKDWLRRALPSSILTSALDDDPNATSILIPNRDVTSDVLQLIVDLSQGREPLQHNPNLLLADRYLNVPELLYYADPYYDQIPNRFHGDSLSNQEFIQMILRENRVWPFGYLMLKGYQPTNEDLIAAAKSGATNIVGMILRDQRVNPGANYNDAIRSAAENGHVEVVKLLLADPRVDPTALNNDAIFGASINGHPEVVALLLADSRVDPAGYGNEAIYGAAANGHTGIVRLLLADPRVDPAAINNDTIRIAAEKGHVDVIRLLLADSRVDPSAGDNAAIHGAAGNGHVDVVRLLLADPQVRNSLNPTDLARYQKLSQQ